MNVYTRNLNRVEFVVTWACTGKCKHCSEGDHSAAGESIGGGAAADAVRKLAGVCGIESLMTFGGEPLLQWKTVCAIHAAARDAGIPRRELITNGYFTKDTDVMREVARELGKSEVRDILLSVDAFHQETIPLEVVKQFARIVKEEDVRLRTNPAWLVDKESDNPYNRETRKILSEFRTMGIETADGNIIFPGGNALVYLKDYFEDGKEPENPYREDPADIRALCINPDGSVLGGNIYKQNVLDIVSEYVPGGM